MDQPKSVELAQKHKHSHTNRQEHQVLLRHRHVLYIAILLNPLRERLTSKVHYYAECVRSILYVSDAQTLHVPLHRADVICEYLYNPSLVHQGTILIS